MKKLLVAALLGLVTSHAAAADPITGKPQFSDGDTFKVSGTKIRIFGIDTPETKQECKTAAGACYACGAAATDYMAELVGVNEVSCVPTGAITYDRKVAVCKVGNKDVALEMLKAGWAVAYRRYLDGVPRKRALYEIAEEHAKEDGDGMWQGQFTMPWDWRRGRRSTGC